MIILVVASLGLVRVFAEETTQETTHSTASRTYTYENYQDLLNQIEDEIYADIYDDVYDDVYQDVIAQINQETYQQIYTDIETSLYEQLLELNLMNDQTQNDIFNVVDIANQSVVGIESYLNSEGDAIGSGVIYDFNEIDNEYYVITNYHVIEGGNQYRIRFEDETSVEANLLKFDAEMDIALLSFSASGLEGLMVAELGSSSNLQKGEIILAAGHPRGFNFFNSITYGVVAGLDRVVEGETITYIQHDAAINSGNSGGPIFNLDGQVVGINVLKYAHEEIEGMGFSIPIDLVIDFINE